MRTLFLIGTAPVHVTHTAARRPQQQLNPQTSLSLFFDSIMCFFIEHDKHCGNRLTFPKAISCDGE